MALQYGKTILLLSLFFLLLYPVYAQTGVGTMPPSDAEVLFDGSEEYCFYLYFFY